MADDILNKVGIHIDELNRLRLLNPEVAETCSELYNESKGFATHMVAFSTTTEALMKTLEELAVLVEAEKLRTMSSRSMLKSIDKQKMTDTQQMQIIIRERQVELERLHTELAAAQAIEREQREYLQQLISH